CSPSLAPGEGSTIADVDPTSYRVAIASSKAAAFCTLTSTIHQRNPSVSSQSQQLSRERAKLFPSDDDDSAHLDGIFRCFSAADLKCKMLERLIRTGHKEGQWSLLDNQITVVPQWLETGQMTIAFTPAHQHETDARVVQHAGSDRERAPLEARGLLHGSRAVENGAVPMNAPEEEWGQKVGYVRDIDDIQRAVENGAVPMNAPEEEWGQKVGYVRDIDDIVLL
ncbi:hypothetical protein Taro_043743, partial [Colocasia esculenta]|nr:hypothetical protein [Colocasia esculenta]